MNRKHFILSCIPATAAIAITKPGSSEPRESRNRPLIPKYLQYGSIVGITCPAGDISLKEIQPAVQQFENWGFKVRLGDTVGKKDYIFGGSDQERTRDFQKMLDDFSVAAIMCARGGYGCIRIIDDLDFSKFVTRPKWILGFSDATVIHSHVNRNFNIASIHSKMCNSFPDDLSRAEPAQLDSLLSIKQALTGQKMQYRIAPKPANKIGVGEGQLVGGNLKTIEALTGSQSDLRTDGKILFVEDTDEYLYGIDRMFWNLKRCGKLTQLVGLVVGNFKTKPDDPGEEFGKTVYEIVLEKVKEFNYPVCFDFPVGHQKENYALKCGTSHRLQVKTNEAVLYETTYNG